MPLPGRMDCEVLAAVDKKKFNQFQTHYSIVCMFHVKDPHSHKVLSVSLTSVINVYLLFSGSLLPPTCSVKS